MLSAWSRINTGLIALGLLGIVTIIAMMASDARGGPLDPPAAPASTDSVKLPGTPISSVPYIINAPGYYYFTRNLHHAAGSGDAIAIAQFVDNVTIDLGGFTLSGFFGGTGIHALGPTGPGQYPLQIINGYVRDFGVGVDVGAAAHARIDRVHVFGSQQNGFVIGNHSVVSNCTAVLNGTNGIDIPGALATVTDCMILDNAQTGVLVDGLANLIESSQIYRNGTNIRFRFGSQGIARANDILYSPNPGVDVLFDSGTSLNRVYNGTLCDVTNNGSADNQTFSNIIVC